MILHVESDADYLVMSGACNRIAWRYYLSDHTNNPTNLSCVNPNKPILTECKTYDMWLAPHKNLKQEGS